MIIKLWVLITCCLSLITFVKCERFSIDLEAPWQQVDVVSNLIESIVGYDSSLYTPAIETIFEINDEEIEIGEEFNDKVLSALNLHGHVRDFIEFNLENKKYAPSVITQYNYYNEKILPQYETRLQRECKTDSFGNSVELVNGKHQTWLVYNEKLYCSTSDLFALQTDKTNEKLQPFDRVIGNNPNAPLLILYGNPLAESTKEFFKILYQDSKEGKIRFSWRYVPPSNKKIEKLSSYGVEMKLTNFVYSNENSHSSLDIVRDFDKINQSSNIYGVENIQDLGIKFTSFLLSNKYKVSKFDLFTTISSNLPKFVHYLAKLPKLLNYEKIKSKIEDNESLGMSEESYGLYINGSPIHPSELDVFKLGDKLKEEFGFVQSLIKLGFNSIQSKLLLSKFALLSAVKQAQFRNGNSLMGNNENRFEVYKNVYNKDRAGVVFFNDIENDVTYKEYSADRQDTYLGVNSHKLKPNQIPPLRENVHDIIFALNFANKQQLRVFFTLSKVILDSGIPQQVGLLPLIGEDPLDKALADRFFHIAQTSDKKETLALLYKYYESSNQDEVDQLLNMIDLPQDFKIDYETVPSKFSIDSASIIFNGVINDLSTSNWQISMGKQIAQDVKLIKSQLRQAPFDGKLKDIIYASAKPERNLKIVPLEPSEIIYKSIDQELIKKAVSFKKIDREEGLSGTFWLITNFHEQSMIDQLIDLLNFMKNNPIQIKVLNYGNLNLTKFGNIKLTSLTNSNIDFIIDELKKVKVVSEETGLKLFLQQKRLPTHHSFMLFNSRYFRLDSSFNTKELAQIIEYEFAQRLQLIEEIVHTYPDEFDYKSLYEFNGIISGIDKMDWFDLISSIITKSFHVDEKLFVTDVNRFDFSSLDMSLSIDYEKFDESKPVDILIIVDPVTEYTQRIVNIIQTIKKFSFINLRILLQPRLETETKSVSKRFYKGFSNNVIMENLPNESYQVEIETPSRWVVNSKHISNKTMDLTNFQLTEPLQIIYQLQSLLIEGFARDIHTGKTPNELVIQLYNETFSTDTLVMTSLNYFQLQCLPGIYNISIGNSEYELLSANQNKYDSNNIVIDSSNVKVTSLDGLTLYPRVKQTTEKVETNSKLKESADINIFTIAGGHQYEKLAGIMIASVRKHNFNRTIKFWILDNFISPNFKQLIPHLETKYEVEIELVTYKWPNFLRKPTTRQRLIWGYKILFLDLLFPQDLDKIIFVDADQICRTDLTALNEIDLEGAPYAFTPMCESNDEMEGFRFWKHGYWSEVLKDDLIYHISALFVVDLKKFKSINAGNRLRSHYQKLSSDPNSLSNLDQDLPNNMQRSIKIKSLPQEWLWCETWCSKETLTKAKMIDLCNNPKTKESKVDVAKRLIPEWTSYEKEVEELIGKIKEEKQREDEEDGIDLDIDLDIDAEEDIDTDYHDEL